MTKMITCLWFDRGKAREAAEFYASVFPDSQVGEGHASAADNPSVKVGEELIVEFTVLGQPCIGLNGGPNFKPNEAVSFMVLTENQEETDRYWNAIVGNGGQESMCGWCKDRWGFSWQITPRVLLEATTDPDRAAAKRAMEAMMTMRKIDIAAIEAARARLRRRTRSRCSWRSQSLTMRCRPGLNRDEARSRGHHVTLGNSRKLLSEEFVFSVLIASL